MKKQLKTFCYAVTVGVSCFGAITVYAQTNILTTDRQTELNVAIYNENIALIKDTRQTQLKQGYNRISYENISAQIIPESALLNGKNISVNEQNFDYDLITTHSLLQKSVGQNVILQTVNPQTGDKERQEATLIAYNNGQPVIAINGEIYTGFKGDILLKNMPKGLISKPSLSIDLTAKTAGNQTLGLTYLTRGLSWQADYVAEFNEKENKMNLNGFITLSNQSGTNFENANMQLIAGDVKVVQKAMPRIMRASAKGTNMVEMAFDNALPDVQEVSDFYVYTLPFKTSVQSKQTKQVSLLSATDVSVQKEYIFDNMLKPYGAPIENVKAIISYQFDNLKENGLGIALPKGVIRLYKEDKSDKAIFLGENTIQHTPNTAVVRLKMGEAFDVFANAKRTDYQKIGKTTTISAYEIKLKNGSDSEKEVTVYENFPGNWKITEESQSYTKETSNRVKWVVPVPAGGESILTYRVQITNE